MHIDKNVSQYYIPLNILDIIVQMKVRNSLCKAPRAI